jgi:urease accessory protein
MLALAAALLLSVLALMSGMSPEDHGPFLVGLMAPVAGLSHFLALLGIGAWTARLVGRAVGLLPVSFLVGILPGFVFATMGVSNPTLDLVVRGLLLVSLVPLAVAILRRVRLATRDAVTTMMVFGGLHVHLLGAETTQGAVVWVGLGVMISAALLLAVGVAVALTLAGSEQADAPRS